MGYYGDKFGDFGDYASKQYGGSLGQSPKGSLPSFHGLKGYTSYPAGYADYDMGDLDNRSATSMALRNAGLGELDNRSVASMALKNAGLGELDSRSATSIAFQNAFGDLDSKAASSIAFQNASTLGDLDPAGAAYIAMKNKNSLPSGLQGYGSYTLGSGDDMDAFAGYDGEGTRSFKPTSTQIKDFLEDQEEDDDSAGFGGLGELQSWHTSFNLASSAPTEMEIIKHLKNALKVVPDDTPADIKANYYNLAMKMLHRRKATNMAFLNIQHVELSTGLGWLVNPALPKAGGFQKAMEKAIAQMAASVGKNEEQYLRARKLHALGDQLKNQLKKAGSFAGFGDETGEGNKKMVLVGLGVAAALAYWYHSKNKKAKRKARAKARARARARKNRLK